MPYIASKCTADSAYQVGKSRVVIKGTVSSALMTPQGATTEVDSATLKALSEHPAFARKIKSGFYQVIKDKKDSKKASKDMAKDKSEQLSDA